MSIKLMRLGKNSSEVVSRLKIATPSAKSDCERANAAKSFDDDHNFYMPSLDRQNVSDNHDDETSKMQRSVRSSLQTQFTVAMRKDADSFFKNTNHTVLWPQLLHGRTHTRGRTFTIATNLCHLLYNCILLLADAMIDGFRVAWRACSTPK